MRIGDEFFRLHIQRTSPGTPPRITVVVGKKENRLATKRNLIKRKTRELARSFLLPVSGYDIVIFPSKRVLAEPFSNLAERYKKYATSLKNRANDNHGIPKNPLTGPRHG